MIFKQSNLLRNYLNDELQSRPPPKKNTKKTAKKKVQAFIFFFYCSINQSKWFLLIKFNII